jgi:tagatose-6-phosphate ketose/aldose isomerase
MQTELDAWVATLAAVPPWDALLAVNLDERVRRGYEDTLREICQQPLLWPDSAEQVLTHADAIRKLLCRLQDSSERPIVATGSGSSEYAAACVAPVLQERLGVFARAVPSGLLLTHRSSYVATADPPLVISFARSGDSPESTAALELLLDEYPDCPHLAITCNPHGRLATAYASDARLLPVVLDERTNDRSLVMTGSFTNMVVAGQALAAVARDGGASYRRDVDRLCAVGREILQRYAADLARIARTPFRAACFLGGGAQLGAAQESALKMLEMSGGVVTTMAETPLGLRHGPMAALRDDTLVVAGLPASRIARSYTLDVLREIGAKRLAASRVIVGDDLPADLLNPTDVAIDVRGYAALGDGLAAVVDVLVGQILAFFRCMSGGLRPDAPSPGGVITRVVPPFRIYR